MPRPLHMKDDVTIIYRIYDTKAEAFCRSGRGWSSKNSRSTWTTLAGAINALKHMPKETIDNATIVVYEPEEVKRIQWLTSK